ncbi:MAG: hypothetical protein ACOY3E_00890 [Pseudomonadota bacterium]
MTRNGRQLCQILLLWLAGVSTPMVHAELHVVVHVSNPVNQLSKRQIVDMFMGRVTVFPDQSAVTALDLTPGDPLRARFYLALTGKSEAQVDAYWATLIFAGRMSPPTQLENQTQLIEQIRQNRHAIGYIESTQLPAHLKSVLTLP